MKLSELSTDKALDVLCELTPYVSNITEDEQILSVLDDFMNRGMARNPKNEDEGDGESHPDGEDISAASAGIRMICNMVKNIPLLLKTHRPDVYGILSVMNERPVAEIAAQKTTDTIRQVRELFQDEELMSFFKSSAQQEQTEPSAPSASSPA